MESKEMQPAWLSKSIKIRFHELLDNQGFSENKNVHEGKMVVIRPGKCINKVSRIC